MKRAIKKLHSRRGASILLALLIMLLATMVSAVIITASVNAVNRVHDDRAAQQAQLSLTSAARFAVACMGDAQYKYIETDHYVYDPPLYDEETGEKIDPGGWSYSNTSYKDLYDWNDADVPAVPFSAFLKQLANGAIVSEASPQKTVMIPIAPPSSSGVSPAILRFELNRVGENDFTIMDAVICMVDDLDEPTEYSQQMENSRNKVKLGSVSISYTKPLDKYWESESECVTKEIWSFDVSAAKLSNVG